MRFLVTVFHFRSLHSSCYKLCYLRQQAYFQEKEKEKVELGKYLATFQAKVGRLDLDSLGSRPGEASGILFPCAGARPCGCS